jgi:hypothetical protein
LDRWVETPQVFWNNIGKIGSKNKQNEWWQNLLRNRQISASFEDEPGDLKHFHK